MENNKRNLLETADDYEKTLIDGGFEDSFDHIALAATFKGIIKDYKKIIKTCAKEDLDIGETNVDKYQNEFEKGNVEEKAEIINEVKNKVEILANACDDVPASIIAKYFKDLVDLIADDEADL